MIIGIASEWIGENVGGLERYAVNLIRNLQQIDQNNRYEIFVTPRGARILNDLRGERVSLRSTALNSRWYYVPVGLSLQLLRYPVDLLHATFSVPPWCSTKKIVLTVQDVCPDVHSAFFPPAVRFRFHWLMARGLSHATMVVVPSEATRRDMLEHYQVEREKVVVIPHGVDQSFRARESVDTVRTEAAAPSIPADFILCVGRFHARKNLERLLEAFALLKSRRGLGVQLVLVGRDLWNWKRIMQRIQELGLEHEVFCPGHITDEMLEQLYRKAKAFAFPSIHEGFGIPPLEAMARGLPVMASNISATPEVVGDAALLVDPYDIEQMTDALERLLDDRELREDLVRRGFERVRRYSWEATARATLELYTKILNNGR